MEDDRGRHAGAAVGDELAVRQLRQRLVPRRVERAGNPARNLVDRVRLAAPPRREPRVDDDELIQPCGNLLSRNRVVPPLPRHESRGLDVLVAGPQRTEPPVEVDHRARVVSPVPEQPPQPLGAPHVSVRHDEDAVADSCARRRGGEVLGVRQGMPTALAGRAREIRVDVEKRRARDVPGAIQLAPAGRVADVPAAVDELVAHAEMLRPEKIGRPLDRPRAPCYVRRTMFDHVEHGSRRRRRELRGTARALPGNGPKEV